MSNSTNTARAIFHGDGALALQMRRFDWAATPLGPVEQWPQSLLTLVSVLLYSHQPMFIAWGAARTLLYNDAYAEILGERDPAALGQPFSEVWPEAMDDVGPVLERAFAGQPTHMDDISLWLERHGRREERHFAFSYTPIREADGAVNGMFCACNETTEKIFADRRMAAETERLRRLFQKAPGFIVLFDGPDHVFSFVNDAYLQLVGHRDLVGLPVRKALPEIEGQGFFELLDQVYRTGEAFTGHGLRALVQRQPDTPLVETFIDLIYQPITDPRGAVTGIFVEGYDVSQRIQSEQALRDSEERWRGLFERMAEGFFVGEVLYDDNGKARDFRFLETNRVFASMTGLNAEDVVGKTMREVVPSIQDDLIDTYAGVVASGEPKLFEIHVPALDRWFEARAAHIVDIRFSVLFLNISERKQNETRRTALLKLEARLGSLKSTAEIARIASEILVDQLGAIRAGYGTVSPGGETITVTQDWVRDGFVSIAGTHRLKDYGSFADTLLRGELLVIDDVHADASVSEKAESLGAIQVGAMVNVPYLKDGRLSAILYVHDARPRVWQPAEIEFLREVGIITWSMAERIEADQAKRESDARFQLLSEISSPQIMWSAAADGSLTFAGQSWLDYSGMTIEEALGSGWSNAIHPAQRPQIIETWQASLASHKPYAVEMRLRARDGSYHWFDARANPVFNATGAVAEWKGILLDIDERKRVSDEVHEAREHLRLMVESAADFAIISIDLAGMVTSWNPGAERIFGFAADQAIGQSGGIIFTPEDRAAGVPALELETAAKEGRAIDERWHMRQDGGLFFASGIMTAMKDRDGALIGFIKIARDVTLQKKAEEELIEARNAAEAANIAKSEFLANMSHEIRTPMNAIIGLSNILATSNPLTVKQREYVRTLQLSADSLLSLINDLLDISKIEARTVELEQILFDLTQMVQEVISMMTMTARQKGLTFTLEGESLQQRLFIGDPTRLRQIILNLCSNAVKFTDAGSVHVAIHEHDTDLPGIKKICIMVRDTGIGIPAKKLDTIFQKFVQADNSINRKYGGTGLGLAITKTLTEIMGGDIMVESIVGKGSVFTVCLPLVIAEDVMVTPAASAGPKRDEERKAHRPRILLVEDYEPNVLVATTFVEEFGYDCDVAMHGVEAIEKFKATPYAAILMDVQMHGMNGLEATIHIREFEKTYGLPRVPIIGMTAHALAGDAERCISAGMDDYIAKPFNPDELQKKLVEAVQKPPSGMA